MGDEKFRLNQDILGHHPTVATIMLGMNDVGHVDYDGGQSGPEVEQRRRASLDTYNAKMRLLIEALQKSGARVILITPSIHDETTKLATVKPDVAPGWNAALTQCAQQMEAWSKEYHTGLVRLHEAMNAITAREQAKDPAFTLIGPDRVHPGSPGHFVMAYVFLRAQGMPAEVAHIEVARVATAQRDQARGCAIDHLKWTDRGVEFDCREKSLPFVPPNDAKAALAVVPFQQELNQESLEVDGLAEGRYTLAIDGQTVGEYSAIELAKGINLAENEKTPQYKQSAAATKLYVDRTRAAQAVRAVSAYYYTISRSHTDTTDRAAFEKKLVPLLEDAKAKNKNPDELAKRQAEFQEATATLLKACQPVPHHFALARK
jgi:lysophospholipase L1-like esterase